jgi:phage gpG-like protein
MKVKVSVSYNAGKLASQMPKIVEKYMQRYGRSAEKGSKEAIDKGLKPPLAQFTIEHRKNKGQGGSKPLFATGNLYRSIKGTSEGLQMLAYGLKHHKGYKNPVKNWRDVPARPFIQVSEKEILSAFNKFRKDIRGAFKK